MATCCRHPDGLGIIIGDFNISELEEGRFNGIDLTFSDGDLASRPPFGRFSRLL